MIKRIYKQVLMVVLVIIGGIPTFYNINHPEITQMQLLIEFWWLYVIVIIGTILLIKK